MDYTKRNKICILKEGMPHAHKACQREREREREEEEEEEEEREKIAHTKHI